MKILILWMVGALLMLPGSLVMGQTMDTPEYPVISGGKLLSFAEMVTALGHADVVFVGENHDDKHAHALELAILKAMYAQNPHLALSLEMFERDVQEVVNEYLSGYITESAFLQASRPWPNYKTDYRPLVEFCRENHLSVVAANAPRRYVNIVSRKGQKALLELPKTARGYLPPLPYSMELPSEYQKQLTEIFGTAHNTDAKGTTPAPKSGTAMPAAMPDSANMIQAQALWDTSMADSVLRFLKQHHGVRVLQVNGGMHSDSGYGIVDRLRKAAPHLKILVVTVKPDADYPKPSVEKYGNLADFVCITPQESAPPGKE
jgi:uncharacterized iron-regulated protein